MEVDLSALPMRVAGVRVIGHTKTKDDVITHFLLGVSMCARTIVTRV